MKTLKKTICQSCGMPMTEVSDFATYDDGSLDIEYCHFCFKQGKFTDPNITMEEKIAKNIDIAVKMGMPKEKATALANETIPKLKRWRK
jgi:hypothetical protein